MRAVWLASHDRELADELVARGGELLRPAPGIVLVPGGPGDEAAAADPRVELVIEATGAPVGPDALLRATAVALADLGADAPPQAAAR